MPLHNQIIYLKDQCYLPLLSMMIYLKIFSDSTYTDAAHVNAQGSHSTDSISEMVLRHSTRQKKTPAWLESYITKSSTAKTVNVAAIKDYFIDPKACCFLSLVVKHKNSTSYSQVIIHSH